MNRLSRCWAATAFFFVAAPLTLCAQTTTAATYADSVVSVAVSASALPASPSDAPETAGPTLANATAGVRAAGAVEQPVVVVRTAAAQDAVPNALPAARGSTRNSVALMIVGGAALITGAIIGDTAGTLIMVGGAGIGLYGLYLYLQ